MRNRVRYAVAVPCFQLPTEVNLLPHSCSDQLGSFEAGSSAGCSVSRLLHATIFDAMKETKRDKMSARNEMA